jgi:hypothetical protein
MNLQNRKCVVMLDIESVGLKGDIVSIQVSYAYMKLEYIFIPSLIKDNINKEYEQFKQDLNNPDYCFIGFNIAFDLWKLYTLFKPNSPFKATFLDLSFHLLDSDLLNSILSSGKTLLYFKAIPKEISPYFDTCLREILKDIFPSKVELKKKETTYSNINKGNLKKSEKTKDFTDLSYRSKLNRKLKTICSLLFRKNKIYNGTDALYLKELNENKTTFFVANEEVEKYNLIKNKLISALIDKNSHTYKYSLDDIRLLWELKLWIEIETGYILKMNINDCCSNIIAYTKYIGFKIDMEKANSLLTKLNNRMLEIKKTIPLVNINSFQQRLNLLKTHTKNNSLYSNAIVSINKNSIQEYIDADILNEQGLIYAKMFIERGQLAQRIKQLDSLITKYDGKRIYPDLRIDGAVTNRMSGQGGLNFQGIPRDGEIRELIQTSFGGDFASLEITLANGAIGVFKEQLENFEKGTALDLHTFTAMNVFTEEWEEIFGTEQNMQIIIKSVKVIKEDKKNKYYYKFKELRNKGKQANFTMLYGGTTRLGIKEAEKFYSTYPEIKEFHKKVNKSFLTLCPENEVPNWSIEAINYMKEGIQNIFGYKRYIKFEKTICKSIFSKMDLFINNLVNILPTDLLSKEYTRNKNKTQKIDSLSKSILCGSLVNLQNILSRQIKNFPIQSSGSEVCKYLMVYLFSKCNIPMLNIHDEIIVPTEYLGQYDNAKKYLKLFLLHHKKHTPFLDMELDLMKNWSDKK